MGHESKMETSHEPGSEPTQNHLSTNTQHSSLSSLPKPEGNTMDPEETRDQPSGAPRREGHGRAGSKRKRQDMGRAEWSRTKSDKRAKYNDKHSQDRRERKPEDVPSYATLFPAEEIAADERKPKKKVAVLIGYSGSGYKGMQLTPSEKTIEGDLFAAFVAAGAISKANADDPKKSSLVRCARTDKGVHAAGNVVSLKLIVEDPDIVKKINDNLSPQIRVWAIQRTNNAFSCYQQCDSRIYEYLIPTHCFLPPHPSSHLAKKLLQLAEEAGDSAGYQERQEETLAFWDGVEQEHIQRILNDLDAETREIVERAVRGHDLAETGLENAPPREDAPVDEDVPTDKQTPPNVPSSLKVSESLQSMGGDPHSEKSPFATEHPPLHSIDSATKAIRAAYLSSKRSYRIPETRVSRIKDALSLYVGTHNYHNYTIQKTFRDPSAARVIKSFVCNPQPILINGTEWLSIKVHGQSFMMHQIRKMVGMVAMAVRCGADVEKTIKDSYEREKMSIPKAPGLGLLLERPVFETWSTKAEKEWGKETIDFGKFEVEIEEFKQREIYARIFREEEAYNQFHNLFNHIDNWNDPGFLWVSSGGIQAVKEAAKAKADIAEDGGRSGLPNTVASTTTATAAAIAVGVDSEGEDVLNGEEG